MFLINLKKLKDLIKEKDENKIDLYLEKERIYIYNNLDQILDKKLLDIEELYRLLDHYSNTLDDEVASRITLKLFYNLFD